MTTESALEKLKRSRELVKDESFDLLDDDPTYEEWEALEDWYCGAFRDRLIAALELVEKELAKKSDIPGRYEVGGKQKADLQYYWDGRSKFAREVLAVVNGETKGE